MMLSYDLSSTLTTEQTYKITNCVRQHWHCEKFSYRSNARPDHGFLLITKGRICFDAGHSQQTAKAGDLIFLPKGSRYEALIPAEYGETEDYLVNFDTQFADGLPEDPTLIEEGCFTSLGALFDAVLQSFQRDERHSFQLLGRFYLLLDTILHAQKEELHRIPEHLEKARKLLSDRPELSVSHIACIIGISDSGLRSSFTKAFGCSPQQFRMAQKIRKAKNLLESTGMSLYQISETLHFYDEAYFCKQFRKYTGLTPRQYAQNKTI